MVNSDLKFRTKEYALSVIRLFAELPKRTEAQVMGRQALRSGTSVDAQYRDASRAKSNADFYHIAMHGFDTRLILDVSAT
jgi:four helix bundle protein